MSARRRQPAGRRQEYIPGEGGELQESGRIGVRTAAVIGNWETSYRCASSPNVTELTVGDIMGINKLGWEYRWVRYAGDAATCRGRTPH